MAFLASWKPEMETVKKQEIPSLKSQKRECRSVKLVECIPGGMRWGAGASPDRPSRAVGVGWNCCREAKEHSKGRWRESKSARSGSFTDCADVLRDKFSAFREFLILRWLYFMKSQCYSGKTWFALTISSIKSVQKTKLGNRADYSSCKVSAIQKKLDLHWLFISTSQCKRRNSRFTLTILPAKSVLFRKS